MTLRVFIAAAGAALALTGCNSFPELRDQVSDRAEAAEYMDLQPIEGILSERDVAQIEDTTSNDLLAAGIGLSVRGGRTPSPNLMDGARAQQARAEQAIIAAAIARERLLETRDDPADPATPEAGGDPATEELLRRVEELRNRNGAGALPDDVAARIENARRRAADEARDGVQSDIVCPPNRPDCAAAAIRGAPDGPQTD